MTEDENHFLSQSSLISYSSQDRLTPSSGAVFATTTPSNSGIKPIIIKRSDSQSSISMSDSLMQSETASSPLSRLDDQTSSNLQPKTSKLNSDS